MTRAEYLLGMAQNWRHRFWISFLFPLPVVIFVLASPGDWRVKLAVAALFECLAIWPARIASSLAEQYEREAAAEPT